MTKREPPLLTAALIVFAFFCTLIGLRNNRSAIAANFVMLGAGMIFFVLLELIFPGIFVIERRIP